MTPRRPRSLAPKLGQHMSRRLHEAARRKQDAAPTPEAGTASNPPGHECCEDNQGLCHRCGVVVNPARWAEYQGMEA